MIALWWISLIGVHEGAVRLACRFVNVWGSAPGSTPESRTASSSGHRLPSGLRGQVCCLDDLVGDVDRLVVGLSRHAHPDVTR